MRREAEERSDAAIPNNEFPDTIEAENQIKELHHIMADNLDRTI